MLRHKLVAETLGPADWGGVPGHPEDGVEPRMDTAELVPGYNSVARMYTLELAQQHPGRVKAK